jgi:hypothetical protein
VNTSLTAAKVAIRSSGRLVLLLLLLFGGRVARASSIIHLDSNMLSDAVHLLLHFALIVYYFFYFLVK